MQNYNPLDEGRAFNEDAPIDFQNIPTQDQLSAQEYLDDLIENSRADLGE